MDTKREAGVLMPVSALPSRFGIGNFGKQSYRFVDLLVKGGYSLWQILPLNPLGYGHSPYQPFSSFALDELYTDLDDLHRRGFLPSVPSFEEKAERVDYEKIRAWMTPYLKEAYQNAKEKEASNIDAFMAHYHWAKAWGLFMSLKRKNELHSWNEWSRADQERISQIDSLTAEEMEAVRYEVWLQMNLYREWKALRAYANRRGVRIVGDVPFYVGFDSCDVWSNLEEFEIDPETKKPIWIAGVPPDYFSATGQRWGNPIYRWDYMEAHGFKFLLDRLLGNAELYDVIRLDHFRAFDTYWRIPSSCPTAMEGSWIEAPGYKFFDLLLSQKQKFEIIAEDLGDLRPEVLVLRDHYSFPGMNVVEFTFHDAEIAHAQNVQKENMVAYIGTHDNDPFKGFFQTLPAEEQNAWRNALHNLGYQTEDMGEAVVRYTLHLPAKYAIISLQDLLGLGSETRLNVPSTINEVNWTWRIQDFEALEKKLPHLASLNAESGR